jgi:protein involved in polysaccharide export with SLBB domain
VVPYQGPETVIDLLHRVGGITAGAAQDDVRVIRPHVAEGKPPEVLRVDLQAILLRHDGRTNLYLQPQDQIYVGETREFSLSKCIPPWLRPIYETLCGMRRASPTQSNGVTG